MKNLAFTILVFGLSFMIVVDNATAGDKHRNVNKNEPTKKVDPKKRNNKKPAPRQTPKKDPKQAAAQQKQQELARQREQDAKRKAAERAKRLAEKKEQLEEDKKREAEAELNRRRARLPRLVSDLVDDRQIGQVEALQSRLKRNLEANAAEQKKLHKRSQELRSEVTEIRDNFDADIEKLLNTSQRSQLAERKKKIEAEQADRLAKREAEREKKRQADEQKKNAKPETTGGHRFRFHWLRRR